jgi:hypothetical protein
MLSEALSPGSNFALDCWYILGVHCVLVLRLCPVSVYVQTPKLQVTNGKISLGF